MAERVYDRALQHPLHRMRTLHRVLALFDSAPIPSPSGHGLPPARHPGATAVPRRTPSCRTRSRLSIDGAKFFLAHESPSYGARSPVSAGFTTVRIELIVDDPAAVRRQHDCHFPPSGFGSRG